MVTHKTPIAVAAYAKQDLKKLLMNPGLNLKDAKAVAEAKTMHRVKWGKLLEKKVKPFVSTEEWIEIKDCQVLPGKVVQLIVA